MKDASILIIDDKKTDLSILYEILKDEGQIFLANGGRLGVEKAQKLRPDIILLDVLMPDLNGFDVLKALKDSTKTNNIPVIFVTGLSDPDSEEQGLALGASDYIHKPFHAPIVRWRVRLHLKLVTQRRMLEELAHIDSLTSIANRRKFNEVFDMEWKNACRQKESLSLAVIDIDHFKSLNDEYGHALGDEALQKVAQAIQEKLHRPRDLVARIGGEEFALILPKTERSAAKQLLDSIRESIRSLAIPQALSTGNKVLTISAGTVSISPSVDDDKLHMYTMADERLYEAKKNGRDCVV